MISNILIRYNIHIYIHLCLRLCVCVQILYVWTRCRFLRGGLPPDPVEQHSAERCDWGDGLEHSQWMFKEQSSPETMFFRVCIYICGFPVHFPINCVKQCETCWNLEAPTTKKAGFNRAV